MKEFDENDAVAYIKQNADAAHHYTDDDVLLLIDTMYDYYDGLGDDTSDEQWSAEAVADFVTRQLARDRECAIEPEHVLPLVQAEFDYETTLDD